MVAMMMMIIMMMMMMMITLLPRVTFNCIPHSSNRSRAPFTSAARKAKKANGKQAAGGGHGGDEGGISLDDGKSFDM